MLYWGMTGKNQLKYPVYKGGKIVSYDVIENGVRKSVSKGSDEWISMDTKKSVARVAGGAVGKVVGTASGIPGGSIVGGWIGAELAPRVVENPELLKAASPFGAVMYQYGMMASKSEAKIERENGGRRIVADPEYSGLSAGERKEVLKIGKPGELAVSSKDLEYFRNITGKEFNHEQQVDKWNMLQLQNNFDIVTKDQWEKLRGKFGVQVDSLKVVDTVKSDRELVPTTPEALDNFKEKMKVEFDPRSDMDIYNLARVGNGFAPVGFAQWSENPQRYPEELKVSGNTLEDYAIKDAEVVLNMPLSPEAPVTPEEETAPDAEKVEQKQEELENPEEQEAMARKKNGGNVGRNIEEFVDTGIDIL